MPTELSNIERHPLTPFLPKNARLLMLGSAFCKEQIVDFLTEKGIALFDTATVVRRLKDNAADQFLEIVEATDIRTLLQQLPNCKSIAVTGQKAMDTLRTQLEHKAVMYETMLKTIGIK
jgi:G:T/U-mismatch repair DNA glycosylase